MDNEDPPCRDTDPVNMNLVGKTSDTMAFTIDFGGDDINQEEKVKKFERFAQRSSLRRVQSPRQEKTAEKEKLSDESKANNNSLTVNLNKSHPTRPVSPVSPTSPTKPAKESRLTKERRSTVLLEKGLRSVSHNRLDSRRKETGGARKVSNEDALSHTGTYTMEEDVETRKDLPDVAMIDKTRFIADWRAKHSGSVEEDGPASRRVLPSAPSKDEITDDSLKEVEKFLARSELTSNIRPGFKPSNKPLIDNSQANGPTSFRSLPYSTNYHQTRQEVGPRTSLRRKPVTGTSSSSSSSYLLSKTNGTGNRSNSCLTSGQAEYKAWKTRKESKLVPSSGANNTSNTSSSSSSSSATSSKLSGKLPLRMSQSLMSNSGNMKRSNSFHHENIQQQARSGCKSTKESSPAAEPITYRTSDDYYLDEDELFLPIFSTEEDPSEARAGRREERGGVSALDTLGEY